jgi:hypothetical protein
MHIVVSHIYRDREGYHVAYKLDNLSLDINDNLWFDSCAIIFRSGPISNWLSLPNFGFS